MRLLGFGVTGFRAEHYRAVCVGFRTHDCMGVVDVSLAFADVETMRKHISAKSAHGAQSVLQISLSLSNAFRDAYNDFRRQLILRLY